MRGRSPSVCRSCVGVAGVGIGVLMPLPSCRVARERCSVIRCGEPTVCPVEFIVVSSDVSLVLLFMMCSGLIAIRYTF